MACPYDSRPCHYPRCAVCTRPAGALDDARLALWRAEETGSSMLRMDYLYQAHDALQAAGLPRWADQAEAAAGRIGGDGGDMRRLLFDVECVIVRERAA